MKLGSSRHATKTGKREECEGGGEDWGTGEHHGHRLALCLSLKLGEFLQQSYDYSNQKKNIGSISSKILASPKVRYSLRCW